MLSRQNYKSIHVIYERILHIEKDRLRTGNVIQNTIVYTLNGKRAWVYFDTNEDAIMVLNIILSILPQ